MKWEDRARQRTANLVNSEHRPKNEGPSQTVNAVTRGGAQTKGDLKDIELPKI